MISAASEADLPTSCIFCGGGPRDGEHVWSDWMAPLYRRRPHQVHVRTFGEDPDGTRGTEDRNGSVVNRTIRVVCKPCNSGWMSRIEANAKVPLSRLMMGTLPHLIFEKHQRALVEWIALKMFVIDCDKPFRPAFKPGSREAFYEIREIPDNLKIDLFRHNDGIWTAQFRRFATMVQIGAEVAGSPIADRNTQSLAFGVGYLLIFAFHSDVVELPLDPKLAVSRRLWPSPANPILWPPVFTLSGTDADAVAETVKDHLTRRYGTPA